MSMLRQLVLTILFIYICTRFIKNKNSGGFIGAQYYWRKRIY